MKKRHLTKEQKFWARLAATQRRIAWLMAHPDSRPAKKLRKRKRQKQLRPVFHALYR